MQDPGVTVPKVDACIGTHSRPLAPGHYCIAFEVTKIDSRSYPSQGTWRTEWQARLLIACRPAPEG